MLKFGMATNLFGETLISARTAHFVFYHYYFHRFRQTQKVATNFYRLDTYTCGQRELFYYLFL